VVGASAAQVTGSRARSGVRAATFTRIARGAVAPNAKQAPGFPRRLFFSADTHFTPLVRPRHALRLAYHHWHRSRELTRPGGHRRRGQQPRLLSIFKDHSTRNSRNGTRDVWAEARKRFMEVAVGNAHDRRDDETHGYPLQARSEAHPQLAYAGKPHESGTGSVRN
ncbi:MAG: hypothetical protein KGS10_13555, partial [Chloroflexi bacterium]|nr:hypothetical protein [Chloroflexota bacterium]